MSTSASMEILAQKYIPYAKMLAKIGNNAVFIVDKTSTIILFLISLNSLVTTIFLKTTATKYKIIR